MHNENKTPKLYVWPNYGLFLGTRFVPLSTYSVTSDQFLLVIEGEIVKTKQTGEKISLRSLLIRAGATVEMEAVDASTAVIAVFYLDPLTQACNALQAPMIKSTKQFFYNHPREQEMIATCLWLRDNNLTPQEVEHHFQQMLGPMEENITQNRKLDPRAVKIMQLIRDTITENHTIAEFAERVHMSDSRLRKLFKSEFGVPITRYRLGHRIITGVLHMATGANVTNAALAAGFASTAHFSKCFRAVTGIHLSHMFLRPPFMDVYIDPGMMQGLQGQVA